MKDDKLHIFLDDPELPQQFRNARRNHGGLKVPEGFFSQFEQKMNAVIDADEAVKQPSLQPHNEISVLKPGRWIRIAAMAALVVAVGLALQFDWLGQHKLDSVTVDQIANTQIGTTDNVEFDIPEQIEDNLIVCTSDYDVYDIYCGL